MGTPPGPRPGVDRQADVDPLVRLDLGGGRTDDVGQRHVLTQAPVGVDAGQHEQRLGVAAHPGGEVVEPEEVLERSGSASRLSSWSMNAS
jgi:hypothetical protein